MQTRNNRDIKISIENLYKISEILQQNGSWKKCLEEIAWYIRPVLIFDNMVVYSINTDTKNLDVIFAKAMGRGRTAEADIAWGEIIANEILESGQAKIHEPEYDESEDRLKKPILLGIPLLLEDKCLGAFVLIRFGTPQFIEAELQLASFIAQQIAFLMERKNLTATAALINDQNLQIQIQKDFISTISHELRNPLGFIKGYSTTLLRDDIEWDPQTQRDFLTIIDHETDHLQELINNLLDSSRLSAGQMEMKYQKIHLDNIVRDVIARSKMHFNRKNILFEPEKQYLPIYGDPKRIAQVLENLINNAVKYAPESEIILKIEQDDHISKVIVEDFGPGIPEKYLPQLFNRFFRNPEQPPGIHGTGLGLFICKQIIDAHNGEIGVSTKENEGTAFWIQLPS